MRRGSEDDLSGRETHLERGCAGDLPAAPIAMSCYGRTGLSRAALGSVTMAVLNLAACPLLVTHVAP